MNNNLNMLCEAVAERVRMKLQEGIEEPQVTGQDIINSIQSGDSEPDFDYHGGSDFEGTLSVAPEGYDDYVEITVTGDADLRYHKTRYYPATYWQPAEGGEIEITHASVDNLQLKQGDRVIELTPDELKWIKEAIEEILFDDNLLDYLYDHYEPDYPEWDD